MRAVREPRAVLAEFGTNIPDQIEICGNDSTANLHYMVLPLRPEGTENFTEEALSALVTRDAMIVVSIGGGSELSCTTGATPRTSRADGNIASLRKYFTMDGIKI